MSKSKLSGKFLTKDHLYSILTEHPKLSNINKSNIASICNSLLDEIIEELKVNTKFKINNFIVWSFKKGKVREHRDVITGEKVISNGNYKHKLSLTHTFKKYFTSKIDSKKTFGE